MVQYVDLYKGNIIITNTNTNTNTNITNDNTIIKTRGNQMGRFKDVNLRKGC